MPVLWNIENTEGYHSKLKDLIWIKNNGLDYAVDFLVLTLWPALLKEFGSAKSKTGNGATTERTALEGHLCRYVEVFGGDKNVPKSFFNFSARYMSSQGVQFGHCPKCGRPMKKELHEFGVLGLKKKTQVFTECSSVYCERHRQIDVLEHELDFIQKVVVCSTNMNPHVQEILRQRTKTYQYCYELLRDPAWPEEVGEEYNIERQGDATVCLKETEKLFRQFLNETLEKLHMAPRPSRMGLFHRFKGSLKRTNNRGLQERLNRLREKLTEMSGERDELKLEIKSVRINLNRAELDLGKANQKVESLEDKSRALHRELRLTKASRFEAERAFQEATIRLTSNQEETVSSLRRQLQDFQDQAKQMLKDYDAMQVELDKKMERLETKITQAKEKADAAEIAHAQLQEAYVKVQASSFQERATKAEETAKNELEKVSNEINNALRLGQEPSADQQARFAHRNIEYQNAMDIKTDTVALNMQVNFGCGADLWKRGALPGRLENLDRKLQNLRRHFETKEVPNEGFDNRKQDEQISNTENGPNYSQEGWVREMMTELGRRKTLASRFDQLLEIVATAADHNRNLQTSLTEKQEEHEKLHNILQEKGKAIQQLRDQCKALVASRKSKEDAARGLEEELTMVQGEKAGLQEELEELKCCMATKEEDNKALLEKRRGQEEALHKLEAPLESVQNENTVLQEELLATKQSLAVREQDCQQIKSQPEMCVEQASATKDYAALTSHVQYLTTSSATAAEGTKDDASDAVTSDAAGTAQEEGRDIAEDTPTAVMDSVDGFTPPDANDNREQQDHPDAHEDPVEEIKDAVIPEVLVNASDNDIQDGNVESGSPAGPKSSHGEAEFVSAEERQEDPSSVEDTVEEINTAPEARANTSGKDVEDAGAELSSSNDPKKSQALRDVMMLQKHTHLLEASLERLVHDKDNLEKEKRLLQTSHAKERRIVEQLVDRLKRANDRLESQNVRLEKDVRLAQQDLYKEFYNRDKQHMEEINNFLKRDIEHLKRENESLKRILEDRPEITETETSVITEDGESYM